MGCCGSRTSFRRGPVQADRPAAAQAARYNHVFFEYVGPTAMTVIGGATRKSYRFDRPGARVAVEPADQSSLANVPNLRLIFRS